MPFDSHLDHMSLHKTFPLTTLRRITCFLSPQELLPPTRQLPEHFDHHFMKAGLEPLVKFRRAQQNTAYKKLLRKELDELLAQEASMEEIVERCQQHMTSTSITDVDVTVMVSV